MKRYIAALCLAFVALSGCKRYGAVTGYIDAETFTVDYGKASYAAPTLGNAVTERFRKKHTEFFLIHVNPSLSELVSFDLDSKELKSTLLTSYAINDSLDVLSVFEGLPLAEPGIAAQTIYVNDIEICSLSEARRIDPQAAGKGFELIAEGQTLGRLSESKGAWSYSPALK